MGLLIVLYGLFALVSLLNYFWMARLKQPGELCFEVVIPARNESGNLGQCIPPLIESGVKVTVLDDQSTDGTASVARQLGASVISIDEDLPAGWTGKNRACHRLSTATTAPWTVFLDADTRPSKDFAGRLSGFLASCDSNVVTGFTRLIPGKGLEPAYLGWVPWILLASNPFGLVRVTCRGHNRFTNGQFAAWRTPFLREFCPYEQVKAEILEDVQIGRLLARRGHSVQVLNLSDSLGVEMYQTLREAFDGMSKNSADIAGSAVGTVFLAVFLFFVAWGWLLLGKLALWGYLLLVLSKIMTDLVIRGPIWPAPFIPLTITGASITMIRSLVWRKQGKTQWKGRTYG